MAQLDTSNTFVDGDVVHASDLNNLVDQASALEGIISAQLPESPVADSSQVLVRTSAGLLRKRAVSTFPSGVTSVSATATPATIFSISVGSPSTAPAIALSLDNQAAGKFLAGPVSGSPATPSFRVLSPADLPVGTVTIAALAIDWSLGSMFMKEIVANSTFTFTNASPGQTIRVLLYQSASRVVAWPAVKWPRGTNPVMTPNGIDIYTFHYIGGVYYGTFEQDFSL